MMIKYLLKGTFNINSGKLGLQGTADGFPYPATHNKVSIEEVKGLYKGHEIAIHSYSHPFLEKLSKSEIEEEIIKDREILEKIAGYPVTGMAYPFGTYNDLVISTLRELGINYSRTVESTYDFNVPEDFLKWHPTCHHGDKDLFRLAEQFIALEADDKETAPLQIFYVWGHSYELDGNQNWDMLEKFFEMISGKEDICYATNEEIVKRALKLK
jgi:peptidoglycan/xylan/chitin deacetylase (PgdA/CDA1 family)